MARTELEVKKQKRKGKKRKHESPPADQSDDEVPDKSLIVEEQQQVEKAEPRTIAAKANKRKQQIEQNTGKEKRSKNNKKQGDDAEEEEQEEEEEEQPTAEQLEEAAKPENANAIVTIRQKKKQKHLQRLESQKDQSADKDAKRNEEYLTKWRDNRQEWKFIKLRQISIQQTIFEEEKLSSDIWPIALEYLAASKGAAKTTISKLAEDAIEKLDKQCEQLEDAAQCQSIVESVRYQRARQLLQSFD